MSDDAYKKLQEIFAGEAVELLANLHDALLALEGAEEGEARAARLDSAFRAAHTLKGAARSAGRRDLAKLVHALEGGLDAVRRGTVSADRAFIDGCLASVDALQAHLQKDAAADTPEPAVPGSKGAGAAAGRRRTRGAERGVVERAPIAATGAAASAAADRTSAALESAPLETNAAAAAASDASAVIAGWERLGLAKEEIEALLGVFAVEAREFLAGLTTELLALEAAVDAGRTLDEVREIVARAFRASHALKGSAASVRRHDLAQLVHELETCLDPIRKAGALPEHRFIDVCLAAIDLMQTHVGQPMREEELVATIAALQAGRTALRYPTTSAPLAPATELAGASGHTAGHTAGETTAGPPERPGANATAPSASRAGASASAPVATLPAVTASGPTVRVPVALLDTILYRLDELLAIKLRIQYQMTQVDEIQEALSSQHSSRRRIDSAQAAEALRRRLESIRGALAQETHLLGVANQELLDDVRQVRMVSMGPMLGSFRRVVRDLAATLGKEIALELRGEDVCVDKRILELVQDPLLHLLRNAVDHGIEPPNVRERAGKPRRGTLRIVADARESNLLIELCDDGRGIDPELIRAKAVEKRLIEPERAKALSAREALNLIFLPGLSTATTVTEVSGRGVGLDLVRENVARLGGRIEFYSDVGKGCEFRLSLPLVLAAARGLLVRAARELYCIPLQAVEEVVAVEPGEVGLAHGVPAFRKRSQSMSFYGLADLLAGRPVTLQNQRIHAIIIAVSDRRLVLGVDELVGQEEVVVRAPVAGTPPLPFVAGVTSLANGKLVTVLDPRALMAAAHESAGRGAAGEPAKRRPTALVVDDTLTTRELVGSVLESTGFRVLLGHDGEAAWAQLQQHPVDVVVTDLEMPILDGLALTRRIRSSTSFATMPIVILSSRGSDEDKKGGAEAGADAYLVKDRFEPTELLRIVGELTGKPR